MSRRDDFTKETKHIIARRVGFCCSHPECGISTEGPHTSNGKYTSTGVAAHITAASELGPRYDVSMTEERRKDASNGIWLCETHAKLIDKDPIRFPSSLLIKWRMDAEAKAEEGYITPQTLKVEKELGNSENFNTISEALAVMKIQGWKQNTNWSSTRDVSLLLTKLSRFTYIRSLRIMAEVANIGDLLLRTEESKAVGVSQSVSNNVYHRVTQFLRYGKVIAPDLEYEPIIQDVIHSSTRYVLYQSFCNPERLPSATVLNLIKFIYLSLGRIEDGMNQEFVFSQLERLEGEITNSQSRFRQSYLNLLHQYQRILPDSYLGILPFDDNQE